MGFLSKALDTTNNPADNPKGATASTSPDDASSKGLIGDVASWWKKRSQTKAATANSKGGGDLAPGSLGTMDTSTPLTAKKGGNVKKTGFIKLHKGEKVLTRKQAKKYSARKKV